LLTGFVRLFVLDTTSENPAAYQDIGIYTYLEQPNTAYLTAHGLDVNGSLYRAEDFTFAREPEFLKEKTDSAYNSDDFEEVLNIRNADTHEKLLQMLDLLQDETVAMEEGKDDQKIASSFEGAGFLYNNLLYQRYLSLPGNLEKLRSKVEEGYQVFSAEWIGQQTLTYQKSILKFLYSVPEIGLLPRAATYVEPYIASIPEIVAYNYQAFLANIQLPTPPTITKVERVGEGASVTYLTDNAQSGRVTQYHLEVSSSADFEVILFASAPTKDGQIFVESLPSVTTFVRIVATDQNGQRQTSSNVAEDSKGDTYYGCVVMERRVGE
jgi:spore coat protein H